MDDQTFTNLLATDGVRAGVEHEFEVFDRGAKVDFREVIHTLEVPGWRIDPDDSHAYKTRYGFKITCDGAEAEIATPPVNVVPGFVSELVAWTEWARRTLEMLVGPDLSLRGVSTHINVTVDDEFGDRASGMFARTFAPAQMLMMDRSDSPGLLVRPRGPRLEIGGEYVTGSQLVAAIAVTTVGAITCQAAAKSHWAKAQLPPAVRVDVVRAVDRYGWYIDRSAFGVDLYAEGRATRMRRELIGSITGQKTIDAAFRSVERHASLFTPHELDLTRRIARGEAPIPLEGPPDPVEIPTELSTVHTLGIDGAVPVEATWDSVTYRRETESSSMSRPEDR
jgi:hypothetical protein